MCGGRHDHLLPQFASCSRFSSSVICHMRLDLPVPNSSTICRRQGTRRVPLSLSAGSRLHHMVIDTTGLRVYGAGEWHVHKHWGG